MPDDMQKTIKEIEGEAESIITKAKKMAKEVLEKARLHTSEILSADLPTDDIEEERNSIIHDAEEEARKQIDEAKKKSSKLASGASGKIERIVKMIVNNIRGDD